MSENVIEVKNLYKNFALPHQKPGSVKNAFTNMFSLGNKTYEVQSALKDISFTVKKGEFFGIVGRNGSGKSTLLKILAGIYQPTKGIAKTIGRIVPFIELGVGFNGELTGRENIYLNGALLGFSEKEINDKYEEIVSFAELERFMDQKLKNYSSGMQVRLAFSVATKLAESDILLIDEVLAVGDSAFQRKCLDYFMELKRIKKTVIFVSHDMGAIQQYCDRAILVEKSEIIASGESHIIASKYHKMFSPKEEVKKTKNKKVGISGEERWGDKTASILSVDASVDNPSGEDGEGKVVIKATVQANADLEKPIIGFSIKNLQLAQLLGTNTQRINYKLKPLAKGEKMTIVWEVDNMFNEGTYYVDSTIANMAATLVADRWPDATNFEISRLDNTPYQVYPKIKATTTKGD